MTSNSQLNLKSNGDCFYLLDVGCDVIKVGLTSNITKVLLASRAFTPFSKLILVLYSSQNDYIDRSVKIRYQNQVTNNDFLVGLDKRSLINSIKISFNFNGGVLL